MTKHLPLLGHRMTRIFPILLFIGLAWGQETQDLADYYFGNSDNYQTLDVDVREILDSELSQIYEDANTKLQNLFQFQTERIEKHLVSTRFNEGLWLGAVMQMKNPTVLETELSKPYFTQYFYEEESIIENRIVKLSNDVCFATNHKCMVEGNFENGISTKQIIIGSKQPLWNEVVKRYGYAELGKMQFPKDSLHRMRIVDAYFKAEFVGRNKCILSSRTVGKEAGFNFYNIEAIDSTSTRKIKHPKSNYFCNYKTHFGTYNIDEVDYNILTGKKEPMINISIDNYNLSISLYDVEAKAKESISSTFEGYKSIFDNMIDDLIKPKLEQEKLNQRTEILDRLEIPRKDANILRNVLRDIIQSIKDEASKKLYWSTEDVKHKKIKRNGSTLRLKNYKPTTVTLYHNGELYSRIYNKKGKIKLDGINPNHNYDVYVAQKESSDSFKFATMLDIKGTELDKEFFLSFKRVFGKSQTKSEYLESLISYYWRPEGVDSHYKESLHKKNSFKRLKPYCSLHVKILKTENDDDRKGMSPYRCPSQWDGDCRSSWLQSYYADDVGSYNAFVETRFGFRPFNALNKKLYFPLVNEYIIENKINFHGEFSEEYYSALLEELYMVIICETSFLRFLYYKELGLEFGSLPPGHNEFRYYEELGLEFESFLESEESCLCYEGIYDSWKKNSSFIN